MRIAYICQSKKCIPPVRVFLTAVPSKPPTCKDHGPMVPQSNAPYGGKK